MVNSWILLVLSLPTGHGTARQRAWRALKASGAAVLRDGVYVLPDSPNCRAGMQEIVDGVRDSGGAARLLRVDDPADESFRDLFDRSADYSSLQGEIAALQAGAEPEEALREARRLRKAFDALCAIDYFPGPARSLAEQSLRQLERSAARAGIADEPLHHAGEIRLRDAAAYQRRVWATRRRPWVDRLASAWLIRRFIDSHARFLWLERIGNCPADAIGFDFDGAEFTHVGERVTFEVLADSFGLQEPALRRLARLVHHLDIGGTAPPEAAGIETLLAGLRDTHTDDDTLFGAASQLFDALHAGFEREPRS